jgi:hypothetical protein
VTIHYDREQHLTIPIETRFSQCILSLFPPSSLDMGPRILEFDPAWQTDLYACYAGSGRVPDFTIESSDPRVSIERLPETGNDQCSHLVGYRVTVDAGRQIGAVRIPLAARLLGQEMNGVAITGRIESAVVRPEADSVYFGLIRQGETAQRELTIRHDAVWKFGEAKASDSFRVGAPVHRWKDGEPVLSFPLEYAPERRGGHRGLLTLRGSWEGRPHQIEIPLVGTSH